MTDTAITTDDIITLKAEAGAAGDDDMVAICDLAIEGDKDAIEAVAEALANAQAMTDRDC